MFLICPLMILTDVVNLYASSDRSAPSLRPQFTYVLGHLVCKLKH
uniref:EDA39 n=1 Tax=Arundo donax TaxID=35708 RepID=A0A0A9AZ78_ARUDO